MIDLFNVNVASQQDVAIGPLSNVCYFPWLNQWNVLLHLLWKRTSWISGLGFLYGLDVLLATQPCVKTLKGSQSTGPLPVAWPYPYFIHNQTAVRRSIAFFMAALW